TGLLMMRPWAHASVLVSARIVLQKDTVIAAAIGNFRIARLRHSVRAFAIGRRVPGGEWNHSSCVGARPFKRTFVLLRAIDVIRELVVKINMIKLPGRLIVFGGPSLATIR